jgi:hypothetical protein
LHFLAAAVAYRRDLYELNGAPGALLAPFPYLAGLAEVTQFWQKIPISGLTSLSTQSAKTGSSQWVQRAMPSELKQTFSLELARLGSVEL